MMRENTWVRGPLTRRESPDESVARPSATDALRPVVSALQSHAPTLNNGTRRSGPPARASVSCWRFSSSGWIRAEKSERERGVRSLKLGREPTSANAEVGSSHWTSLQLAHPLSSVSLGGPLNGLKTLSPGHGLHRGTWVTHAVPWIPTRTCAPAPVEANWAASQRIGMAAHDSPEISALLKAWGRGDLAARDQLMPLVYEELRRRAKGTRRERLEHTLEPTALVHETYLRLAKGAHHVAESRAVLGVAAQMMRRILVDHARAGTCRSARRRARVSLADLGARNRPMSMSSICTLRRRARQLRSRGRARWPSCASSAASRSRKPARCCRSRSRLSSASGKPRERGLSRLTRQGRAR